MRVSSRTLLTVIVSLAMLGVLYPVMRHFYDSRSAEHFSTVFYLEVAANHWPATSRKFETRSYESYPVFKAEQGKTLEITIRSERSGALHVHGYDKQIALVRGGEVRLRFDATEAGLFPIHLHGADNVMEHVATLEVHPR